jgi:hypothetical protein
MVSVLLVVDVFCTLVVDLAGRERGSGYTGVFFT